MSQFKFQILETRELPLDAIVPNPHNPRPVYHFNEEDLAGIANSLNQEGQHLPAVVYELAPENPGMYMLLQGERRWRSSRLAPNKTTLLCGIVSRPSSFAEELVWLGVEESFKQEWGQFGTLQLAYKLAHELGLSVTDPEVRNKLGISPGDARVCEKLFKLEEPVWRRVEEYDAQLYTSRQEHQFGRARGAAGREFTASKAALVWDLYELIRKTSLKAQYTKKLDLQERLATIAGRTSLKNLQSLTNTLRDHTKNPNDQVTLELTIMLENPTGRQQVERLVRKAGKANVADLASLVRKCEEIQALAKKVAENPSQLGSSHKALALASRAIRGAVGDLATADHRIDRKMRTLTDEEDFYG